MPAPAAAPTSPDVQTPNKPLRIVMAGLDNNIDQFAREAAHEKHAARTYEKGPIWKRVAGSMWNTLTREYQIVKGTQQARQEILESGNLRHHHGESDAKWREDTVRRFSSDFGEHLIHEEAGETYQKLGSAEAAKDPEAARIRSDILDLVRGYARGDIIDSDNLNLMLDETVAKWRKENIAQGYIGEGQMWATNVVEMAEQVKAALDARTGLSNLQRDTELDAMLEHTEIVTGEARVGSRVELDSTLSERLAEKMKKKKWVPESLIGRAGALLSNELVVAGMLSVGIAAARKGSSYLTAAVLPGLGAGIVAAWQERRALKGERALQARRADADKENVTGNEAQAELQGTQYETRAAGDLLTDIGRLYDKNGDLIMRDRAGLQEALRVLADINARIDIEDRNGTRLINFADISADETEGRRFDLDLARAKLKTDLEKLYGNPAAAGMLDIKPGETYEQMFADQKNVQLGLLKGEIDKKDRLFNKIVRKRAFNRAVVTVLSVVAAGGAGKAFAEIGRETYGAVRDFLQSGGLFGKIFGSLHESQQPEIKLQANEMPLTEPFGGPVQGEPFGAPQAGEAFGNEAPAKGGSFDSADGGEPFGGPIKGEPFGNPVKGEPFGTVPGEAFGYKAGETITLSDTVKVTLPEGFTAQHSGGNLVVTAPSGESFTAALNKDGTLTNETIQALRQNGFQVIPQEVTVEGKPKITHDEVNAREFVDRHKAEMTRTKIVGWFGNESGVYDQNELRLDNHEQRDGDMVISIDRMAAEGSYNQSGSVDWQEAAREGKLKVFLSAAPGSQTYSYEFPMNEDGKLVIDKDHPARALFNKDGEFIGGRQRVALVGDTAPNGTVEITPLATVVGSNANSFTDTVITPTYETGHIYTILPPAENAPGAGFTSEEAAQFGTFEPGNNLPPVLFPVYSRRTFGAGQAATRTAPAPAAAAAGAGTAAGGGAPPRGPAGPAGGAAGSGWSGRRRGAPRTGTGPSTPGGGGPTPNPNPNAAGGPDSSNPNTNDNQSSPNPNSSRTQPGDQTGGQQTPNTPPPNPNTAGRPETNPNGTFGSSDTGAASPPPNPNTATSGSQANPNATSNPNAASNAGPNATPNAGNTAPNAGPNPNTAGSPNAGPNPNTATGAGANAGPSAQGGNTANSGQERYSAALPGFIRAVDAESRTLPGWVTINTEGLSDRSRKLITTLFFGAQESTPRNGRSAISWREDVFKTMKNMASTGHDNIEALPPQLQTTFDDAFSAISAGTTTQPSAT